MLEHRPNSIQDMSNSTVISDSHSHRFDFATPTDLLDTSPMKNQGAVFFVGPGSGIPSHDTLRHSHQLKCTQIRIPHTENPVNNVPWLISDSDGVLTLEPRPSYMTPSESVYSWLLSRLEFPVSSNLIEMPHQVKSDSDFFCPGSRGPSYEPICGCLQLTFPHLRGPLTERSVSNVSLEKFDFIVFWPRRSDSATWAPFRASTTESDSFLSSPYKKTS